MSGDGPVGESGESPRLRAQPYHCPYCGLDELRPAAEGWLCLSCARNFTVRLLAVRREDVLG
jgi:transposase-like protein